MWIFFFFLRTILIDCCEYQSAWDSFQGQFLLFQVYFIINPACGIVYHAYTRDSYSPGSECRYNLADTEYFTVYNSPILTANSNVGFISLREELTACVLSENCTADDAQSCRTCASPSIDEKMPTHRAFVRRMRVQWHSKIVEIQPIYIIIILSYQ